MGASSSSPKVPPPLPPAAAPSAAAPSAAAPAAAAPAAAAAVVDAATQAPAAKVDCDTLKKVAMKCSGLQYDRWLHPQRHGSVPPDYTECDDAFEAWQSCVLESQMKKR